jgi:hypothetical protein
MVIQENSPTLSTTIPVDAEHGSLRLAVAVIFLVGWVLFAVILSFLIPSSGLNLIAIVGGLVITTLLTQALEKNLKHRWPSGREVSIDPDGVRVMTGGQVQRHIEGNKPANVLLWRFEIKRRTRVPKGWYMIACALEQENVYLPVYTFVSPDQFKALENGERFTALVSEKDENMQNVGKYNLRLAGEQRRLRLAEDERWRNGAEMTPQDFQTYLEKLKWNFAEWMATDS